jgi:hypothetical protein
MMRAPSSLAKIGNSRGCTLICAAVYFVNTTGRFSFLLFLRTYFERLYRVFHVYVKVYNPYHAALVLQYVITQP